MKDFDIQLSMSGTNNEISNDIFNQIETDLLGINPNEDISSFEASEDKKSWIDSLNKATSEFKKVIDYKTPQQIKDEREKEMSERGTKYKVLGMNPFVAIGLSFAVIIGISITITKIK